MKNLRTGTAKFDTIRAKDANGLSIQDDGGNGLFIKDGGNVGIGTTDPDAGLHVVGDFGDPSTSNLITRLSQSSGNGVCDIGFMAVGATSGGSWFQSRDSSDSSKYALLFNPEGGNVGIGITDPSEELSILGNIKIVKNLTGSPANGDILGSIAFEGANSVNTNLQAEAKIEAIAEEAHGAETAATGLQFYTKKTGTGPGSQASPSMRIDSAGNVGIGHTSPGGKLHVTDLSVSIGSVTVTNSGTGVTDGTDLDTKISDGDRIKINNEIFTVSAVAATTLTLSGIPSTEGTYEAFTDNNGLIVTSGGNVGIGATNPGGLLELRKVSGSTGYNHLRLLTAGGAVTIGALSDDSNPTWAITTNVNEPLAFQIGSNNEIMRIHSNGNVGIGTTDPDAGLHVVGDFGDPSTSNLITRLSQSSGNGVCDIGFMAVGATSGGNWFQSRDSSDSSKYALLFNPEGGNVGIGTTNPLSKLQIDGGNTSNSTYAFSATGASDATSKPSVQMCYDNGSTSYTMVLSKGFRSSGYILGASNSSNALCFQMLDSGDMETVLGNQIGTISDIRTKDSVVDATPKLSDIMKLRVVNFTRKDDPDKTKLIGFVAQEVEEVFPRFVASRDNREYDEDGNVISGFEDVKSVKFDSGFAILTKAIQEQQSIIEQLQSQNASLESRISALES